MTIFLAFIAIPALMVMLSMTLPARVNRATNLVVASLYIPVSVFNAAGASWDWAFFYGLSIGVEVLLLAFVDGILNGLIWRFDISSTLLTIFLVSVSIPALMVVLSMTLPARVNRATNLVVASLLIPYSIFNAAGATWEWAAFYGISIGIEVLLLAFILRSAWTWPRTAALPAGPAMTGLRQEASM